MEQRFKAFVVWLILDGKTERALEALSKFYSVEVPRLKVGLRKRHGRKTLGCYVAKSRSILVLKSDVLKDPFVILHEFYHHLRMTPDAKHKGTERNANEFAREFLRAYGMVMASVVGDR